MAARSLAARQGRRPLLVFPSDDHPVELGTTCALGVGGPDARLDDGEVGVGVAQGHPNPRPNELEKANLAGDGIAGQPYDGGVTDGSKRQWLSGLHSNFPEVHRDTEFGHRVLDDVEVAHAHAAGRHDDVSASLDCLSKGGLGAADWEWWGRVPSDPDTLEGS